MTYPIVKYPSFLISTAIALVCFIDVAVAKTPDEIRSIAQAVTVEINLKEAQSIGSGVIIHHQGEVYTLITNRHVVCGTPSLCSALSPTETYQLKFGDGMLLNIGADAVKMLGTDLDLAIIQFRSNRSYQVAKLAKPGSLKVSDLVYTSGYPNESREFSFHSGEAVAVVNKRLVGDSGGYTVIYTAHTQIGMSGGGVFNEDGHIVSIHGLGEEYRKNTDLPYNDKVYSKIGYNRGIPLCWIVQGLTEKGINLGYLKLTTTTIKTSTADEYFIEGFNKFVAPGNNIEEGKQQATKAFTQAIRLNPSYVFAYFWRAMTYEQLGNTSLALTDYNRAISLDPQLTGIYLNRGNLKERLNDSQSALADYDRAVALDSRFAATYLYRSRLKEQLNDPQGAKADYDRAIALDPQLVYARLHNGIISFDNPQNELRQLNQNIDLNPQDPSAYITRGILKANKLNDPQGALADYNQAIAFNPSDSIAHTHRGILKYRDLKDLQGGLADLDRAIALAPYPASQYVIRGILKDNRLNDPQGALADYNRAIALNPRDSVAYLNRGILKDSKLNDPQGALEDFDRAIALDLNSAQAYYSRGILKTYKLRDFQGALADFNRATALDPQNGIAFGARGTLKYTKLNDRTGGIADIQTVVRLAKAQSNYQLLNTATQQLQSWGVNTRTDAY
jgi:tetratricopeptide (TPR) repeat protein